MEGADATKVGEFVGGDEVAPLPRDPVMDEERTPIMHQVLLNNSGHLELPEWTLPVVGSY
jgi:hypothetical protein